MAYLKGPNTPSRWGQRSKGMGINATPAVGSWVCISGQAGEVVVYSANQVLTRTPEVHIFAQATGSVSIEYTLGSPDAAKSREPGMETAVPWTDPQVLVANSLEPTEAQGFTAIRITFAEQADLYIYAL